MEHMTAKVSCFARAFHFKNNEKWIFKDEIAGEILGTKDYEEISLNMSMGIRFFAPRFKGTDEEALRFIVDYQLSPSVLGRSAFCERHLENERKLGCSQYVIFASGYDTFVFRDNCNNLKVFELDMPEMIMDKQQRIAETMLLSNSPAIMIPCNLSESEWKERLQKNGFEPEEKSFGSLLGISYYLSKKEFTKLLLEISEVWKEGSAICFDYPVGDGGEESKKNRELAKAANEQMKAKYDCTEMEQILSECGFLVYEHLDENGMTKIFFEQYNNAVSEHQIYAPKGVHYIFAVKK